MPRSHGDALSEAGLARAQIAGQEEHVARLGQLAKAPPDSVRLFHAVTDKVQAVLTERP